MVRHGFDRAARASAAIAGVAGLYGAAALLGLFGPVSRWTSGRSDGTVRTGTESGVDFLLGNTGGNAPVLFFWSLVLLLLSTGTAHAVWSGRTAAAWAGGVLAAVVTVIGLWSVGWYFALPALGFLVAAGLLTLGDRRGDATTEV